MAPWGRLARAAAGVVCAVVLAAAGLTHAKRLAQCPVRSHSRLVSLTFQIANHSQPPCSLLICQLASLILQGYGDERNVARVCRRGLASLALQTRTCLSAVQRWAIVSMPSHLSRLSPAPRSLHRVPPLHSCMSVLESLSSMDYPLIPYGVLLACLPPL